MERNIDINLLVPKFKVDEKTGVVKCTQSVTLRLFKEVKFFYGKGESDRMKGNVFNKSFGQGMAYARAVQDVMRKVEVGFIKYSFDHLLEENITDIPIGSLLGIDAFGDFIMYKRDK